MKALKQGLYSLYSEQNPVLGRKKKNGRNEILKKETLGGALLSFRSLQNKSIRATTSKQRDEHKK